MGRLPAPCKGAESLVVNTRLRHRRGTVHARGPAEHSCAEL